MRPYLFNSLIFCLSLVVACAEDDLYQQTSQEQDEHNVSKVDDDDTVLGNVVDNDKQQDVVEDNDNKSDEIEGDNNKPDEEEDMEDDDTKTDNNDLPNLNLTSDQIKKFNIWPEAKIPFYIDEFSYDKVLRDKIRSHLDDASSFTGVLDFEELPTAPEDENERWVLFVNRRGQLDCMDYSPKSFTNSGVQKVIIGYDCLNNHGPMAAVVLALAGVPPQHNAPNRDEFIEVSDGSILPDKINLFARLSEDDWLFGSNYDFQSAGHYHSLKHTADGKLTISMKKVLRNTAGGKLNNNVKKRGFIRENNHYSVMDIKKIRALYFNIARNNKRNGIQMEQCHSLYEPGSNQRKHESGIEALKNSRNNPELLQLSSLER